MTAKKTEGPPPLAPVTSRTIGPATLSQASIALDHQLGESALGRIVRTIRIGIADLGASLREEFDRRPSPNEVLVLLAIVLVPTIITAFALRPELTVPTPSVNDDSLHFLFIKNASDALANGQNIFDHWDSQIEAGVPQFLHYLHLPALMVVGIQRLSFGFLDLLTTFNAVRFALMALFPLTVYVSMRTFGFSTVASAIAAAASTLLSGNFRYGLEYDSYTFRGFGLFTQLWAMHLSFLTIATAYAAMHRGRRVWIAALLFGILALTDFTYTYITTIGILFVALWGISRLNVKERTTKLAVVMGFATVVSAYMWVPLLTQATFLNASPYVSPQQYDSFGAGPILGWLVSGDFLDHGRPPVLTAFLAFGIVATLLSRTRASLIALGLLVVFLLLYFGRPTIGPVVDLLPFHGALMLSRFSGAVDLAVIILIGVGGAAIWPLYRPQASPIRLAGAALVMSFLLAPAVVERYQFLAVNAALQNQTSFSVAVDTDAAAVIEKLHALPRGRVYAGLPVTYGREMSLGSVAFYDLLAAEGIESLAPPSESSSLNADYIWDFDDQSRADFDLWNVRYLVALSDRNVASFLTPILQTTRYTLYEAPTTGYSEYVEIAARRPIATQQGLFESNLAWLDSKALRTSGQFFSYDYPAGTTAGGPGAPGCPGGGTTAIEVASPGRFNFVVECAEASTLMIKTTYNPNWQVAVDGRSVETFMVSPSFIGVSMPAGRHGVVATYEPTPIKTPLLILGLVALLGLLAFRNGSGRLSRRIAAFRSRRRLKKIHALDTAGPPPKD